MGQEQYGKQEITFRQSLGLQQAKNLGTWSSVEKKMIMDALVTARGKRTKAAALLGWGRSTLWRKMKQYGIDG
jgi:transcriptional regulator of acetoin/glycerol metabolism